jgi:hypothetical protein
MLWGHELSGEEGGRSYVSRLEYNTHFGAPSPEQPEIPECGYHAWEIWWRLNARRPTGENQNPISWGEMESFMRMTGIILSVTDVTMIEAIDNAFISASAQERKSAFDRSNEKANPNQKR